MNTEVLHRGTEWLCSVEGIWHWAEACTCKSVNDDIEAVKVRMRIEPPMFDHCRQCVREWERKRLLLHYERLKVIEILRYELLGNQSAA